MDTAKRSRNPTNSPDKSSDKPTDKSARIEVCKKCNESVSEDCIECYWCSQWEHRGCANIKETELVVLSSASQNILYFCSCCLSVLPEALSSFKSHSQLANELQTGFQSVENKLSKEIGGQITAQFSSTCQKLQNSIDELSSNINKLIAQNSNVQMETDNTSESIGGPAQARSYASVTSSSNTALSIVDELADREKRKKNVIVYNLPEASDHEADKCSFLDLCKKVYNADISVNKMVRLGKKSTDKQRPLLISLKHDEDKSLLLLQSYLLRRNSQHSNVFMAPDRTKFEREKHKKLVEELKERRSQGAKDLVIRNGVIISKHSRPASQPSTIRGETSVQSS